MCFANANVLVGQERHITNCCRDSLDESFKHVPLESFMTDSWSLGRIREHLSGLLRIVERPSVRPSS